MRAGRPKRRPTMMAAFPAGRSNRPALQRLLTDISAGLIDIVVVYKVDRLTRSLADFAKLVELFDAHKVSFVSVTQAFNTTTSMGRLTLNVLLSFAQFEREVTSERIRDKIGASKRKGLWVGGMVPLGYASLNKKLVVVPEEAERVRLIFQRYLRARQPRQGAAAICTPGASSPSSASSPAARSRAAFPSPAARLAYLLRNRFYIGEVVYRGSICPAEHEPILDRDMFEAVQAQLDAQRIERRGVRRGGNALLAGKLFDDQGSHHDALARPQEGHPLRLLPLQRSGPWSGGGGRIVAPGRSPADRAAGHGSAAGPVPRRRRHRQSGSDRQPSAALSAQRHGADHHLPAARGSSDATERRERSRCRSRRSR